MPDVCTQLVIINCWPVSAHRPYPSKRRIKAQSPLHISAILYGREYGLISNKVAERLLGTSEQHPSGFPSVVGISWALSGSEQGLETSEVHVVPGLEQDLVLGDNTEELYQSAHLTPPPPSQDHEPEEQGPSSYYEKGPTLQLNTREDFVSQGIMPKNQQSQDALKHLLTLCRTRAQSRFPKHKIAASKPEETRRLSETSDNFLHGFRDIPSNFDSENDWVMPSNEKVNREKTSSLQPSNTDSLVDPTKNVAWEISTEASEAISHTSQSRSPVFGWSLVDTASGDSHPSTPELVEEQNPTHESQNNDFASHPGHRFWEWDVERQLWRRKGRNESDEMDWFDILQ
ncbi:hypothetical protein FBEOM_7822 [Fusarium beomiforme]|uniref:Uncharacterized protein n=1 Tax=Fusarium beomiforme TaxID=44412 RepID=A0A9P5AH86_9HYPO|nr:hypothetical protein FBEOM_7822 [Fusarium beomiforme]